MPDRPTRAWLETQIQKFQESILKNQGAVNSFRYMLENGIYIDEGEKGPVIENGTQDKH